MPAVSVLDSLLWHLNEKAPVMQAGALVNVSA